MKQIGSKLYKILVNRETVIRHIDQIKRSSTPRQPVDDMWDDTIQLETENVGDDVYLDDQNTIDNEILKTYPRRTRHPVHRYGFDIENT